MDTPPVATRLSCTQCGGELHPDEGQAFLTCPYCGSTVYVDKSQVVFHYYLASTLDEAKGRGFLARWMAGNQTVKDLDQKSRVVGS
jgi:DNA-directed RNA polymerase subunit RPC12/RpoP